MTTTGTLSGVVEARNERGVRVAGEWRNQSKFHPVELPDVGAQVALGLDSKGFITSLEVLEEARPDSGSASRDRRVARVTVLKAAASFGASRPDLKSGDVLKIADSWLAWVEEA
jgi:hypothetical protein